MSMISTNNNRQRVCRQQSGRLAGVLLVVVVASIAVLLAGCADSETFPSITVTVGSEGQLDENTLTDTDTTNDEVTIRFTASSSAHSGIEVAFSVSGTGGAVAGSDYVVNRASPVTIAAGTTEASITIAVVNDTDDDDGEGVAVAITSVDGNGAEIGTPASNTIPIIDDDGATTVTVSHSPTQLMEADASDEVTVTFAASRAPTADITVEFSVSGTGGAVAGSDYRVNRASPVTIAAGTTEASITITVGNDTDDDDGEGVTVTITSVDGDGAEVGTPASATIPIVDDDGPTTVTVSHSPTQLMEANTSNEVTVTFAASRAPSAPITVVFSVSGTGGAVAGSDYRVTGTSPVTIAAGTTEASITIAVVNDTDDDDGEGVTVTITSVSGLTAKIGDPSSTTISIDDNDEPIKVTISHSPTQLMEANTSNEVTVTFAASRAPSAPITVVFSVGGTGGAMAGSDYSVNGTSPVTIAAGTTEASITIAVLDDTIDDDGEGIEVTIDSVSGLTAKIGEPRSPTIPIVDNDGPTTVTVSHDPTQLKEANADDVVTVTFTASRAPTADITVRFSVSGTGGAVADSDYRVTGTSPVTIAAGTTEASITIAVVDDTDDDDDEGVTVTITSVTGADARVGSPASTTIPIVDDDEPITVTISHSPTQLMEANTSNEVTVTFAASRAPSAPITVVFSVSGTGGAVAGRDYRVTGTSPVTIAAGTTEASITIAVVDDTDDDDDEGIEVAIDSVSGLTAKIGDPSSAAISIDDNDEPITVSVSSIGDLNEADTSNEVTVTFAASRAPSAPIAIAFSVSSTGGAVAGSDYVVNRTRPVTIAAGTTEASITIAVVDDTDDDDDEGIEVAIDSVSGLTAKIGDPSSAAILIDDNDEPITVSVSSTGNLNEADTSDEVTVTFAASRAPSAPIRVMFSVSGTGGAVAGSDYVVNRTRPVTIDVGTTEASITIVVVDDSDYRVTGTSPIGIAAGTTEASITIAVVDDTDDDDGEGIEVTIDSVSGLTAKIGDTSSAAISIDDNDDEPITVSVSSSGYLNEADTSDEVTVTFAASRAPSAPITVVFGVSGTGGAVAGSDYRVTGTSPVTIAAGITSTSITIAVVNDTDRDYGEGVTVAITSVSGANAERGSPASTTIPIVDDDDLVIVNVSSIGDLNEADTSNEVMVTFTAGRAPSAPIAVAFSVSGTGGAVANRDYVVNGASPVTIAAGTTEASITIAVVDDTDRDYGEGIKVVIDSVNGDTIQRGTMSRVDIAIVNRPQLTHAASIEKDFLYQLAGASSVTTAVVGTNTTYLFVAGKTDNGVSVFGVADNGDLTYVHSTRGISGANSMTTAAIGTNTYLFVAGETHNGVSVFSVADSGVLTRADSVNDSENIRTYHLRGIRSMTTAVVGTTTYLFVAGSLDNGVSVFSVADNGVLTHANSVADRDNNAYQLLGASSVTTAVVGTTTYLFVAGSSDNGVSVFSIADTGVLTHVQSVDDSDNSAYQLLNASSLTTAVAGSTTYLFVAGYNDNGVSVFSVADSGMLTYADSVNYNEDVTTYNLNGANVVTTAVVGSNTYLFVTGEYSDGISVFNVADNGVLTHADSVKDREHSAYQLDFPSSVTIAVVGSSTYLFVAGVHDSGVSIFNVAGNGVLTHANSVNDDYYQLDGASSVATAVVEGSTYLFVAGSLDDGVSVFGVGDSGELTHADSIDDNLDKSDEGVYQLDGVVSVTTAVAGGTTYLFVAGVGESGASAFSVAPSGRLTHTSSVNDRDNRAYQLHGANSVTAAVVESNTYLFVAGYRDDGVSVFSVDDNGILTHADSVDDRDNSDYRIAGASSMTTAVVGTNTYLFVAGRDDSGVSVFSVAANGILTHAYSVKDRDNSAYQLHGASSVTTAVVGSTTYLFAAGANDSGVSVFSVADNGELTHVHSVDDRDNSAYKIDGTNSVTTALVGSTTTFLFVAGYSDSGVSIFSVADNGVLTYVHSVDDRDNSAYKISFPSSVTTAEVGSITYLFAAGIADDGVSIFSFD